MLVEYNVTLSVYHTIDLATGIPVIAFSNMASYNSCIRL